MLFGGEKLQTPPPSPPLEGRGDSAQHKPESPRGLASKTRKTGGGVCNLTSICDTFKEILPCLLEKSV